ncbi:TPA: hypothetical protein N3288_000221 [Klebsiella aerogenes]|nr:hypothetical protein [Klebsiella aerogenes]
MPSLKAKYMLPAFPVEVFSPTARRIFLEEEIIRISDLIKADIATAHRMAEQDESILESEIQRRVNNSFANITDLKAIVPCHYAQMFVGDGIRNDSLNQDPSCLIHIYQVMGMSGLENAVADISKKGLNIFGVHKVTDTHRQYFCLNGSMEDVRNLVKEYHAKAIEKELAANKAEEDDAQEQFKLFRKHAQVRLAAIGDIKDAFVL